MKFFHFVLFVLTLIAPVGVAANPEADKVDSGRQFQENSGVGSTPDGSSVYAGGSSRRLNNLVFAKAGPSWQAAEVPVAEGATERVGFMKCVAAKNPLKLMLAGGISGAMVGGTLGYVFGLGGGALPGMALGFVGGSIGVATGDMAISMYECMDPNSRPMK